MKMSEQINELVKALVEFQSKVPAIKKNCQGYGYMYADLNDIMTTIQPILGECGLAVTQNPHCNEQGEVIGVATHVEHISGQYKHFDPVIIPVDKKAKNIAHEVGTDVTYARRYSLSCALNIVTDQDTDGVKEPTRKEKQKSTESKQKMQVKKKSVLNTSFHSKHVEEQTDQKEVGKRYLFALCKQQGINDEERREIILYETGKSSSKMLSLEELRQVCTVIKNRGVLYA